MELPSEYISKMTELLGEEEFEQYKASLDAPRASGVRVNTLKISTDDFTSDIGPILGECGSVPWTTDGFYYDASAGILPDKKLSAGKLPFYHAGLYYIQEPSAMYPAEQLGVRPGDKVLDMCAAPGGKSTKIACALKGEGLLVSNDISEERVKALIYNIELSGARNVIVTNESPERLADKLPGYFDKILVDAPCSGEGMFRKDDEAVKSWGVYKNEVCADMQREILESAHVLLKCGGRLLYSTCTFDPSEDEYMIKEFMEKHPEYVLVPLLKTGGVSDGMFGMDACARLWPQRLKGEGHFTALLEKRGDSAELPQIKRDTKRDKKNRNADRSRFCQSYRLLDAPPDEFVKFWNKNMTGDMPGGVYYTAKDALYYSTCAPDIDGLKVPKIGLRLGEVVYNKFTPAQQFCMAFGENFKRKIHLTYDGDDIRRYLRGETLTGIDGTENGFLAVCVDKYAVGMGVLSNGVLKNLYPKGWRRMI